MVLEAVPEVFFASRVVTNFIILVGLQSSVPTGSKLESCSCLGVSTESARKLPVKRDPGHHLHGHGHVSDEQ